MRYSKLFIASGLLTVQTIKSQKDSVFTCENSDECRNLEVEKRTKQVPLAILDTDYGPFIDDVFALGLLLNTQKLLDFQYILTTSERPDLSAKCVAKHLQIAKRSDIRVGVGASLPSHETRAGIFATPDIIGFALEEECADVDDSKAGIDSDGHASLAKLIIDSGRNDWFYVAVGGQSSLMKFVKEHREAANKIDTVVIMGGNWCVGYEPFPGVAAPCSEANVALDPVAANYILDKKNSPFQHVYYVPLVVGDKLSGELYGKIVEAAGNGASPSANATIELYRAWSRASRANPNLLAHNEAMEYDPETQSTPQYDAITIMQALELVDGESCEDRLVYFEVKDGVRFLEAGEGLEYPEQPRAGYSLLSNTINVETMSEYCSLTEHKFDPSDTPEEERPVYITIGYKSKDAKDRFFASMANRMIGIANEECA